MKIIEVVQHLAPGGIETLVLELQKIYSKADKVIIVSLENNKMHALSKWARLTNLQCELVFLNKQPGLRLDTIKQLIKLFARQRPDVIHTHHIGPLLYAGLAARHLNLTSIIHTEHDVWHLQSNKKHRFLQKVLLSYIQPKLVADAHYVGEALSKLFPKYQNHVISNGIDVETFHPGDLFIARNALQLPQNVKIIGCAARLVNGKGHPYLFEAMMSLPDEIHLVLAGDGPLKPLLMTLCERLNIQDRVHFLGSIDNMTTFYQSLDVFCLPSEAEGLPLSPLEAQACNIPVIVTDVGGCNEAVCAHTGKLIPPKSIDALVNALSQTLEKEDLNLKFRPRDFIHKEHSLNNMASQYRDLM